MGVSVHFVVVAVLMFELCLKVERFFMVSLPFLLLAVTLAL
jgi:hypothetical protein